MGLPALVCLALALQPAQPAPPLAGVWNGALEAGGARLRLVLHVRRGASLSASIDSVDQGAMNIPVTAVTFDAGEVRLELRQLQASFAGRLSQDGASITGQWRQSGASLPLVFRRGGLPGRPQEPAKPYPYREEEAAIENREGGVKLAGTLTLPLAKAPVPALVLLTGSGPQDRDESVFGHRPFLVLADHLTRRGYAVLRMDDRGVGGSSGDLAEAALGDLAGDALAAVRYLQKREEIDARRIGLAGHSEGALAATIAAVRSADVAFLVLMAAPGVPAEEVMYSQSALLGGGMEERNRRLQRRLFAAVKETADRAALERRLRGIAAEFLGELAEEERKAAAEIEKALNSQVRAMSAPSFRALLLHNPAQTLGRVKAPVLVVAGSRDVQVRPDLNLPPIAAALEAGRNPAYDIVKLPGLNHLLQTCRTGGIDEYAKIEETMSPQALNVIASWLDRQRR